MIAHIKFFLSAGHETSAITLTWALIELARHPDIQQKLREELQHFSNSDPTWDQLKSDLPLLDATVYETLRLYPALRELIKTAAEDDVIPLSSSIVNASGEMVDFVLVPKGTTIILPNVFFNRSEEFWGPDAQEFVPERWLREFTPSAKEIRGHRHLFTFSDGPKRCLGMDFAVAELKAALSVLIRSFTFELPDGPDTKLDLHLGILPRPKLAGESSAVMPMRVKQVMIC
jgi:cytochrome P450